ncbi:DNA topoisomerase [Enterobacter hormaechei]
MNVARLSTAWALTHGKLGCTLRSAARRKEKVVNELKQLAEKADHIYLATDLDREGEAIAWHLREVIGGDDERYSRVVFNEITKNAIRQAFEKPGELNIDRVNAQQARRFMDRVVGYMVSPLLWKKVARGLSAGRVQSVAVRLVVEREREIKAFVPEEFWEVDAERHHAGRRCAAVAGEPPQRQTVPS